jgi:hypothetical protein
LTKYKNQILVLYGILTLAGVYPWFTVAAADESVLNTIETTEQLEAVLPAALAPSEHALIGNPVVVVEEVSPQKLTNTTLTVVTEEIPVKAGAIIPKKRKTSDQNVGPKVQKVAKMRRTQPKPDPSINTGQADLVELGADDENPLALYSAMHDATHELKQFKELIEQDALQYLKDDKERIANNFYSKNAKRCITEFISKLKQLIDYHRQLKETRAKRHAELVHLFEVRQKELESEDSRTSSLLEESKE